MKMFIALALIATTFVPSLVVCQDCIDYSLYPHLVAQTPTPSIVVSISIQGDYAYMGDYSSSNWNHFHVIDTADPNHPAIIASLEIPIRLNGVAASGSLVCGVGGRYSPALAQMILFDVGVPEQPAILGYLDLPDDGFGVALDGSLAYIACGRAGLLIVDVSDPASPAIMGNLPTTDVARGIRVSAGVAYLATNEAGLLIVDVSDPTAPVIQGAMPTTGYSMEVALAGEYCLVADGTAGMAIVDVSESTAPVAAGRWIGPDDVRDVVADQDTAFLVDSGGKFRAIDISDPTEPVQVFSVQFGTFGTSQELEVAGGYAFLAARSDGLRVIDLGNRSRPSRLGSLVTGPVRAACFANGFAFVTQDTNLMAIDISDPSSPVAVGNVPISGTTALSCTIEGNLVFVTRSYFRSPWGPDEVGGLDIFDVSDPAAMQLIGTVDINLSVVGVDVDGGYAYLACTGYSIMSPPGRLSVVDINDPANPVLCGSLMIEVTSDVAVGNGMAVVTDGASAVYLVDVSDPLAPQLLDIQVTSGTSAESVDISGSLAFVGGMGLAVFQLDGFQGGSLVGAVTSYGGAYRTTVAEGVAYTVGSNTLHVFDVTVPETPLSIGSCFLDSDSRGIALAESSVLCGSSAGLVILPRQCTSALSAVGESDEWDWVRVLSGVSNYPNPFNPQTTIAFELPNEQAVSLRIFDVSGRLVRELVDGEIYAQGRSEVTWNGRDDDGRQVAAGVYFYRLDAGEFSESKPMALVK